jgi:hypothetical protein
VKVFGADDHRVRLKGVRFLYLLTASVLFLVCWNSLDHSEWLIPYYQKLTTIPFDLMSKITAPAFRQSLNPYGAPQGFQIILFKGI